LDLDADADAISNKNENEEWAERHWHLASSIFHSLNLILI
jgi:hypothetical protein